MPRSKKLSTSSAVRQSVRYKKQPRSRTHSTILDKIAALGLHDIVNASKAGVGSRTLKAVQAASPFSEKEWSAILDMTPRSLQRYKEGGKVLSSATSERVLLIAQLLE